MGIENSMLYFLLACMFLFGILIGMGIAMQIEDEKIKEPYFLSKEQIKALKPKKKIISKLSG